MAQRVAVKNHPHSRRKEAMALVEQRTEHLSYAVGSRLYFGTKIFFAQG